MKAITVFALIILIVFGSRYAVAQTVTVREEQSFFYKDGNMKEGAPEFEKTFVIEENAITRTKVDDFINNTSEEDQTVYYIQKDLPSHPGNFNLFKMPKIIRAIGKPGLDGIETLAVGVEYWQAVKSTNGYFTISRYKVKSVEDMQAWKHLFEQA